MNIGATHVPQWHEVKDLPFSRGERDETTIWITALSRFHDIFISAAARGLGYNMQALETPDNEALKIGKEYGNRGQCNPTYYTGGAFIKKLQELQAAGASPESIIRENVFLTAGACGPCRFGMYATEYRKALREAGFEGLRILQLKQSDIATGNLHAEGLDINLRFIVDVVKSIIAADVLNLLAHRIRPYEVNKGETEEVVAACIVIMTDALEQRKSLLSALRSCRTLLGNISVDRLQPKPTVCVIGEIWAMSTEGDGNYGMHRFLEEEGAEVLVQPLYNWLLYLFWEQKRDVAIRRLLRAPDQGNRGLYGKNARQRVLIATLITPLLKLTVRSFARAVGLTEPHIVNVEEMAIATDPYYGREIRGGEGFMEVGKFLDAAEHDLAHLVVSIKPFGCLPSSGVSDGVQSLVTARKTNTAFYAIETTGDGHVSVYSRVQMMLCNAKKRAQAEFDSSLENSGLSIKDAKALVSSDSRRRSARYYPPHYCATTAANLLIDLGLKNDRQVERQY